MKRKPNFLTGILCLTILLLAGFLIYFGYISYQQMLTAEKELTVSMEEISKIRQDFKDAEDAYSKAVTKRQTPSETQASASDQTEQADISTTPAAPSVFSQNSGESFTSTNGYIIGIDPGHQSEAIDMSATEPNGPGSSVMKAKATTGTQGSYTGVPEYQLNLEVSLKLKTALEQKGYQTVLTRTDNETAISNAERAQLVAQQGADIYVRIHANGDDSHTASGALTMAPSPENPYVSHLSEDSVRLSQCILDAYCTATGFSNLGVQYYDNMTGINWSSVPVTILEMGFMTYESDDRQMNDPAFQDTMVSGIVNGIDAYFGL